MDNNIDNNSNNNSNSLMDDFMKQLDSNYETTSQNVIPNSTNNINKEQPTSINNTSQSIVPNTNINNNIQTTVSNTNNVTDYLANKNITVSQNNPGQSILNSSPDYLDIFVGGNSSKYTRSSFNIWAFLFGGLYFLYRKMYLYGIIILLIESSSLLKIPFLSLIVRFILAFIANSLYVNHANKKISKIKLKETDQDTIIKKCQKKGGTSKIILLIFVAFIGYLFYIAFNTNSNTINNIQLTSLSNDAKDIKTLIEINKAECPLINNCDINNLYKDKVSGYNFNTTNNYYLDSLIITNNSYVKTDRYLYKSFATTNTLDSSTIIYNNDTKEIKVCLVVNKNSKYYSKDYAIGGKRENTDVKLNLTIPEGTLFACSDDNKSWQ